MSPRKAVVAALGIALVLGGAACNAGDAGPGGGRAPRPSVTAPATAYDSYVALGDSFTAGPFVPVTDLANGCLRSSGNYPSLVAERLHVRRFTDVSCSGARTRDLREPQRTFQESRVPPQLRAVHADTDLVTLGIGGNDFRLFGTLVDRCTALRNVDPTGSPCADELERTGFDTTRVTAAIGRRVARAIRLVRERAPRSTVVVVGYPRLAPPRGSCPGLLPLADGDVVRADRITRALDGALAGAAARTRAVYVDTYAASAGHDICSPDPWVNGRTTDRSRALAYHPLAAGMAAVADLVVDRL